MFYKEEIDSNQRIREGIALKKIFSKGFIKRPILDTPCFSYGEEKMTAHRLGLILSFQTPYAL